MTENAAQETLLKIRAGADRALAWLIVAHFPVVLGVAAVHGTWWAAVLVGAPLAAIPFWLARTRAGALVTRLTIAVAFMGMASTVVRVVQGTPPPAAPGSYREPALTIAPAIGFLALVVALGVYMPDWLDRALSDAAAFVETTAPIEVRR